MRSPVIRSTCTVYSILVQRGYDSTGMALSDRPCSSTFSQSRSLRDAKRTSLIHLQLIFPVLVPGLHSDLWAVGLAPAGISTHAHARHRVVEVLTL
jgi:hypothetical protein